MFHVMGRKLYKDSGISNSVTLSGFSVQEYIKNHPQSERKIDVFCILYHKQASTVPAKHLWNLWKYILCLGMLPWPMYQMT